PRSALTAPSRRLPFQLSRQCLHRVSDTLDAELKPFNRPVDLADHDRLLVRIHVLPALVIVSHVRVSPACCLGGAPHAHCDSGAAPPGASAVYPKWVCPCWSTSYQPPS